MIALTQLWHDIAEWTMAHITWWTMIGLLGQSMFMFRFLWQWIASEKAGESVIPVAFWYFSIAGSVIVLAYGIQRDDLVIIVGQLTGVFIYVRNLHLIYRNKKS